MSREQGQERGGRSKSEQERVGAKAVREAREGGEGVDGEVG